MASMIIDAVTGKLDKASINVLVILALVFFVIVIFQHFTDMDTRVKALEEENRQLKEALNKQLKQEDVELRCRAYQTMLLKRFQAVAMITSEQCRKTGQSDAADQWAGFAVNLRNELDRTYKSFDPALESDDQDNDG